jgi:two-component system phosphate regulon sensor histidine kinase PhoR
MQKKILYVLVLMSCCVLGITGLQLYWNYQNYKTIIGTFKKDVNDALDLAVDQEKLVRRKAIIAKFEDWLSDTTIVRITCDTNNMDHSTIFTMQDVVPYYPNAKADKLRLGISSYKEKVGKITPAAKTAFINHLVGVVEKDLKNSITYFYTQGLGHRLEKEFGSSRPNKDKLYLLYEQELLKKDITSNFQLNSAYTAKSNRFLTYKVNAAFKKPYEQQLIWASLENPNNYYLREMKWLIFSSALLIGITIFCFYYTVRTLLNQHKLVAIKNQFINNMTHEINTPLASIQVTAEALQQFDHDKETQHDYLNIILYQTNKLNNLTSEILENAKLESLDIKRDEHINLNEIILTIIKDLKLDDNVDLTYLIPQHEIIVKGNKAHLARSIANIIENAFKYNTSARPIIEIILKEARNEITLTIKDNGPGIADEFKEKVFDQFYRIPTGNIHNIKGYGLGLSYVKKIINQHCGNIFVSDNYPIGTVFSIKLPK